MALNNILNNILLLSIAATVAVACAGALKNEGTSSHRHHFQGLSPAQNMQVLLLSESNSPHAPHDQNFNGESFFNVWCNVELDTVVISQHSEQTIKLSSWEPVSREKIEVGWPGDITGVRDSGSGHFFKEACCCGVCEYGNFLTCLKAPDVYQESEPGHPPSHFVILGLHMVVAALALHLLWIVPGKVKECGEVDKAGSSSSSGQASLRQNRALATGILMCITGLLPSGYAFAAVVNEGPSNALVEGRRTTTTQCYTDGTAKIVQQISMQYSNLNTFYTIGTEGYIGISVGAPGDIDGDGVVDMAVGVSRDDDSGTNAGAMYILFLQTDGMIKDAQKLSNLYGNINAFYSLVTGGQFGYSVTGLGDIDGDSVVDLAVGAYADDDGSQDAGAAYLLYLETDGKVKKVVKFSMLYSDFSTFFTLEASDRLGTDVSALGNLDGDSLSDLAVGADLDDDGGLEVGAVYVLFLQTDGRITNAQKISALYGNFGAFYTLYSGDLFGHAIGSMGDIDGDGVVKLAVGARGIDEMYNSCGGFFVLSLETDGSVKSAQKVSMLYSSFSTFYTFDAEDYFGTSIN